MQIPVRVRSFGRQHQLGQSCLFLAVLTGGLLCTHAAHALLNAGVEAGVVKRTASAPDNLKLGFGYGAHVELSLFPALNVGAYFLRSTNAIQDAPSDSSADATFNTLGLRARLILPISGDTKPYGYVGLGHNWIKYSPAGSPDISGQSWEVPIGVGIAHKWLELFQFSLEAAYRPSVHFTGDAYETANVTHPSSGWSALVGFAIDL